MKRVLVLFIIIISVKFLLVAQVRVPGVTVYKQFKPSTILLSDGRIIRQSLTNVFLKNSSLLYMKGSNVMQANMKNVKSVTFDDRQYVKIDTLLAYRVDSVGSDALYCATIIDTDAYQRNLKNNRQITSMNLNEVLNSSADQLSFTSVDISNENDFMFPLIDIFFYEYRGKIIRVHERNILNMLPKEKRTIYKSVISLDSFSWTNPESLLELLKRIQ